MLPIRGSLCDGVRRPMDATQIVGLAAAAFAAGAVNAAAGGGSNISFAALLAAGYDAKTANVTSSVALWPGYFGGVGYSASLTTVSVLHCVDGT